MPLDAVCLQAVVGEIAPAVIGSRIEKIQQPARDQVVLLLRHGRRLLLCANPNQPRIQLTELIRDNPAQPPMFCMLLRKYLQGGVITDLVQEPLERVVTLTVRSADELGERSDYRLVLELVGRRANLILCDENGRIIDCLRRVDLEMSEERQVLPGLFYHLPPGRGGLSPLEAEEDSFAAALAACPAGEPLDRWLVDSFTAMSPLVAREVVCRAFGDASHPAGDDRSILWDAFAQWRDDVKENRFIPAVIKRDGVPSDFSYLPVEQYGGYAVWERADCFCALLDEFYVRREQAERVRQRGRDLLKTVTNARDRVRRKLAAQEKEYLRTLDRDQLRLSGELITANLYRMERGQARLTAQNYYADGCPEVEIRLDPRLSPQENAARYFKQYTKAKTAERVLTEQLEKGRGELAYLESVLQELSQAESEQDFLDVRAELESGGYLRTKGKKQVQRPSRPREFRSSTGLRILVGRNNRQNDKLTRDARRWDIWLHTQKIHGSHVILCAEDGEPDERSIYEAAVLAAFYSQARDGAGVSVDYTPARNVKKPVGSRPGMVVYTTYQTIVVDPDESLVKSLGESVR